MIVEEVAALGVDVEDVEGRGGGVLGELGFDAVEEGFEDGRLEGVEEEEEGGGGGEVEVEGVLLEEVDGGEAWGGGVGGVEGAPVGEVLGGDGGHGGVELDADDLVEGELRGDEDGAAFAGADVDEGVVMDGVGWEGAEPEVDEGAEDAGGDAVVGGDMLVVGVAGDEVACGDEAAGVGAVDLVEGVDGVDGGLEEVAGADGLGHVSGAGRGWGCRLGRGCGGRWG